MAYLDWAQAERDKKQKEAYEALKEKIKRSEEPEDINAWFYLQNLEREVEDLKNQNNKYSKFFQTLDDLLPRRFSIHDKIG